MSSVDVLRLQLLLSAGKFPLQVRQQDFTICFECFFFSDFCAKGKFVGYDGD